MLKESGKWKCMVVLIDSQTLTMTPFQPPGCRRPCIRCRLKQYKLVINTDVILRNQKHSVRHIGSYCLEACSWDQQAERGIEWPESLSHVLLRHPLNLGRFRRVYQKASIGTLNVSPQNLELDTDLRRRRSYYLQPSVQILFFWLIVTSRDNVACPDEILVGVTKLFEVPRSLGFM